MIEGKVQYLTAAGLAALQKEFEELKNKSIPDIANRIDDAKQQGDLSENAEYHQAKEDMAWAQGRLMELRRILDNAQLVEKGSASGVVVVGSTVIVKTKNTSKEYTIVGPQEADPLLGKISNESPLGEAFIGHKKGDVVEVRVPSGTQTFEIVDIQ